MEIGKVCVLVAVASLLGCKPRQKMLNRQIDITTVDSHKVQRRENQINFLDRMSQDISHGIKIYYQKKYGMSAKLLYPNIDSANVDFLYRMPSHNRSNPDSVTIVFSIQGYEMPLLWGDLNGDGLKDYIITVNSTKDRGRTSLNDFFVFICERNEKYRLACVEHESKFAKCKGGSQFWISSLDSGVITCGVDCYPKDSHATYEVRKLKFKHNRLMAIK